MRLDYGKRFTDQWGALDPALMANHWANELAGYNGKEISIGVKAMESKEWPPTLPEFKRMCRPHVDALHAYYEAVAGVQARIKGEMGVWSHPAIFWASAPLSFDLGNQTYSQIKTRWEDSFNQQMSKGEWPPIPQPSLALAAPGKGELSKEKAAQMLEEIGASEILKPKTDHKLWAKRIMERKKRGDKTLTMIQIQFAQEALAARSEE